MTKTVRVRDFTTLPGGRFIRTGDGSAEKFYLDYLEPVLAEDNTDHIVIDISETWGYPTSFTSQLGIYLKDYLGSLDALKRKVTIYGPDKPDVVERFWQQAEEESNA